MRWIKMIKNKKILAVILFVGIFLLTRLPKLGLDSINPDAVNWHYRSEQFVVGLKQMDFLKTYQHYHPGVTLMWLSGIPIELFKQLSGITVYDQFSFYSFHTIAKLSIVFAQLVLSLVVLFVLSKVVGFGRALLFSIILSAEPFFLGNSRLFHMDTLFTLLIFLALTYSYQYIKKPNYWSAILCGLSSGLSFLTRSLGIGAFLYVLFAGSFFQFIKTKKIKDIFPYITIIIVSTLVTVFLLFPALWVKPVWVIKDIFSEGERIGVRNGHNQIYFGNITSNPGPLFYPIVLLMKSSPFMLVGVLLYALILIKGANENKEKTKEVSFNLYALLFYAGYLLVMIFPTKKIDRYMLVLFPYLALIASYGYYYIWKNTSKKLFFRYASAFLFFVFIVVPVISLHPHNFTYASPIFGTAAAANRIIGQKPFGIGIYEVKDHMQKKYGSNVRVGLIDTKPIKAIYPNSLVSDIRINGVSSYDILILGINEEFSENVLKSDVKFIKDSSLYINGLEYWRFYVKESK